MMLSRIAAFRGRYPLMAFMKHWVRVPGIRIFDAPLYLHWSILIVLAPPAWFIYQSPRLTWVHWLIVAVCYLTIVVIHEAGHAAMAHRLGYRVIAIRVGMVHGVCEVEAPEYEWHDVLIHWAGVLAQFAIGIPCLVVYLLARGEGLPYVTLITALLGRVNLFVALINLIPVRGLDGYIAWRILFLWREVWVAHRVTRQALQRATRPGPK